MVVSSTFYLRAWSQTLKKSVPLVLEAPLWIMKKNKNHCFFFHHHHVEYTLIELQYTWQIFLDSLCAWCIFDDIRSSVFIRSEAIAHEQVKTTANYLLYTKPLEYGAKPQLKIFVNKYCYFEHNLFCAIFTVAEGQHWYYNVYVNWSLLHPWSGNKATGVRNTDLVTKWKSRRTEQ